LKLELEAARARVGYARGETASIEQRTAAAVAAARAQRLAPNPQSAHASNDERKRWPW
jgi:hypothetical protein